MLEELAAKTVLVIEDTHSIRAIEVSVLREMGVGIVHESINGTDALKKLQQYPQTHLIVCDWDMPEMNGLELLQEVRKQPQTRNIPFLMVTGVTQADKVRQAIQSGVNDYMVKPFQQSMLVDKATKLLG